MLRNLWNSIISFLYRVGAEPDDSEALNLKKAIIVGVSLMGMSFGLIYTPYYYSLGNMFGAISTIAWIVVIVLNLFVFSRTRKFARFRDLILLTLLIVPFLQHLSEGGYTAGAGVLFALIVVPLALIATDLRRATIWYLGIVFVFILAGFLDPFARTLRSSSITEVTSSFILNFVVVSLFIFVFMRYFVSQRDKALRLLILEQEKSESLLLNILPKQIADILKKEARNCRPLRKRQHYVRRSFRLYAHVGADGA
ncbi:MAG: hypothetical protein IIC79_07295 [Chloroflexi bacterium]|nr:hypothetical protein [Chloroflexota bacterium]